MYLSQKLITIDVVNEPQRRSEKIMTYLGVAGFLFMTSVFILIVSF